MNYYKYLTFNFMYELFFFLFTTAIFNNTFVKHLTPMIVADFRLRRKSFCVGRQQNSIEWLVFVVCYTFDFGFLIPPKARNQSLSIRFRYNTQRFATFLITPAAPQPFRIFRTKFLREIVDVFFLTYHEFTNCYFYWKIFCR